MKYIIPSIQWFLFIISGSIVAPLTIASIYGLDAQSTLEFMSRTLIVLALSGLLQVSFGHRLPITDGPSGLWWGIFVLYASIGLTLYGSENETLRVLEFSLIVSGLICIGLSVIGVMDKLSSYFTPTVTGTYLLLLVAQLSGSFLKGLLGIDAKGEVSVTITFFSLVIIVLSLLMSRHLVLRQFNIIASMAIGWLLFYLLGYTEPMKETNTLVSVPTLFTFGLPRLEWSIVPTVFFVTLLLITNMLASIKVVENVLKIEGEIIQQPSAKKAGLVMGVSQIVGGLFAAIGSVPISGSAAFIATSKITSRIPFIMASCFVIVISFFSPLIVFFTSLPTAVGYAAIFPVFAGMITLGIREFIQSENVEKTIRSVGIPLFTGIGIMFVPSEALSMLPSIVASIMSNGLITGTVIALLYEMFNRSKEKKKSLSGKL
jgi:xanthine/uracil permease